MPVKPKKVLPARALVGSCHSNINRKAVPPKSATKGAVKPGQTGKKAVKKAPRTKPGYELYAHDEPAPTSRQTDVKTLVEEWMTRQEIPDRLDCFPGQRGREMEVEAPGAGTTMFNRRLVSSTPDPDRVLDSDRSDVQMIPERDVEPQRLLSAPLSDARRLVLRQHLDAALMQQAVASSRLIHDSVKNYAKVSSPSGLYPDDPEYHRAVLLHTQVPLPTNGPVKIPRPLTKRGIGEEHKNGKSPAGGTASAAGEGVSVGVANETGACSMLPPFSQPDPVAGRSRSRESDIMMLSDALHRDQTCLLPPQFTAQEKQFDNNQHVQQNRNPLTNINMGFTAQETDCLSQGNSGLGRFSSAYHSGRVVTSEGAKDSEGRNRMYVSKGTNPLPNMSMGFTPPKKDSLSRPESGSVHLQAGCQPLSVVIPEGDPDGGDGDADSCKVPPTHAATPACSPVNTARAKNLSFGFQADNRRRQSDLSENHEKSEFGLEPAVLAGTKQKVGRTSALASKQTVADNYTCDGYFINGPEVLGREERRESPRRVKLTSLPVRGREDAHLNENNNHKNSFGFPLPGNSNQNRHNLLPSGAGHACEFPASAMHRMEELCPGHEAMAEGDLKACDFLPDMMDGGQDVEVDLPAVIPHKPVIMADINETGPQRLRSLILLLKSATTKSEGLAFDLARQMGDLVDHMPQLQDDYDVSAEIAKAVQHFRTENSRLNRRLKNANDLLRIKEKQEKDRLDPKIHIDTLNLQTENMELSKQLVEISKSYEELSAVVNKQQQEIQRLNQHLSHKDHSMVVERQELLHQVAGLRQEVQCMSYRTESLQSKLAAADRQSNIHDVTLRQKDLDIATLHDTLGKMKQAALEVIQHVKGSDGDVKSVISHMQRLPSFQLLCNLLNSNSMPQPDRTFSTLGKAGPLDVSGNYRYSKPPDRTPLVTSSTSYRREKFGTKDPLPKSFTSASVVHDSREECVATGLRSARSEAAVTWGSLGTRDEGAVKSSQGNRDEGAVVSVPLSARDEGAVTRVSQSSRDEVAVSKGPLSARSAVAASPLTLEAVAAHNQQLEAMQARGDGDSSLHRSRSEAASPLTSSPQSAASRPRATKSVLHKLDARSIKEWSTGVESERQQAEQSGADSVLQSLSEVTIDNHDTHQPKAGADTASEIATVPTLSEFPISESGDFVLGGSDNDADKARHSITDYFQKYPEARQDGECLPKEAVSHSDVGTPSPSDKSEEAAAVSTAKDSDLVKQSPTVSSPNSTLLSCSSATQKDHFHGTELDLSLSTIQEDALSSLTSLTGITGVSICTAMSLDDRKFKEGVNALDEKILQVKESLQTLKNTFS